MGFSFNEPTVTHPSEEEVTTTTEEQIDATNSDADGDLNSGDSNPDAGNAQGNDENAGGDDPDGEGSPEEGAAPEEEKPGDKPEQDTSEVSYFFGGEEVSIEVDPSHREAFEAKGLDIDALAAELYRQDGDFSLTPESYEKCCEAFGKFAIDALISGLKAQNEMAVSGWKMEAEQRVKADEDRFNSITADIGGEEGWSRLEEFALANLSDDELAGFNEVMASGNNYLQQYALRELEGRRKAAQGDDSVKMIEGNASTAGDGDNSPLSARDYIMATSELGTKYPNDKAAYARAQAQLDARRRAGAAAGL